MFLHLIPVCIIVPCSYILYHNNSYAPITLCLVKISLRVKRKSIKSTSLKMTKKKLKSNYRPVSILPSVSKINERSLYNQINEYFHALFSNCGSGMGTSKRI